jgi:propionyl-CoA synthetase
MRLRQIWHAARVGRQLCTSNICGAAGGDPSRHAAELEASLRAPEEYWARVAENTVWSRRWDRVVDNPGSPFAKWFPGGELSLCYNAVDRHVDEGYGEQTALIWDSPITGRYSNAGSEIWRDRSSF